MYSKKSAWIVILFLAFFWGGVGNAFGGSATLNWTANEESDLNEYRVYFGERSRNYGPYIPVPSGTQYTVEGLEAGKTYYFAVTAVDTSGNESGFSQEVNKSIAAAVDTVAPDIQILQPTDAEFFIAQSATISLAGSASDNVGVAAVTWSTDTGESGQATGTNAWEISDLSLSAEQTTITVAALDEAGNRAESSILISYADSRSAFSVSQVQAANEKAYSVETNLTNGQKGFIDRSDTYSGVPAELAGSHYIRTSREDSTSEAEVFLQFSVSEEAVVYVAYHDLIDGRPSWMNGFADTGVDLTLEARKSNTMSIYRKTFSAGEIVLGGNGSPNTSAYMYTVIVKPSSETQLGTDSGTDPPAEEPSPEDPPAEEPSPEDPPAEEPSPEDPPAEEPSPEDPPAEEPSPEDPPAEEPSPAGFSVDNVVASNGKSYLSLAGLKDGEKGYIDRNDAYDGVPAELEGSHYIRTSREDSTNDGDGFLRFTVSDEAVVYVAYHDLIDGRPSWMSGFADTGVDLTLKARKSNTMSLYRRTFSAGEIVLGGNGSPNTSAYMYTVIVKPSSETQLGSGSAPPAPAPIPEEEPSIEEPTPEAPPSEEPAPEEEPEPPADQEPSPSDFSVGNVMVSSGKSYAVFAGLRNGERGFIDRNETYSEIPSDLVGAHYIRTAREDSAEGGDGFLRFTISSKAMVYVAHHNLIDGLPSWMVGFTDTGEDLILEARKANQMSLYRKEFPAGEVVLGGNGSPNSSAYMYTVIVKPAG